MAFAYLTGGTAGSPDQNTVTSGAIDTSNATLLVVVLGSQVGVATNTISDSKGNSWNALTTTSNTTIKGTLYWSVPTSVGAGHTFTASNVLLSFPSIAVLAFSGTVSASPFDQQSGGTASTSTTVQPGSVTPGTASELFVTGVVTNNTIVVATIDNGFTVDQSLNTDSVNFNSVGGGHLIQGGAAALNPTWTVNTSATRLVAVIATFRGALAGRMFEVF